jgi:hypothetical protein
MLAQQQLLETQGSCRAVSVTQHAKLLRAGLQTSALTDVVMSASSFVTHQTKMQILKPKIFFFLSSKNIIQKLSLHLTTSKLSFI